MILSYYATPGAQVVEHLRPGTRADTYGDVVADWSAPTRTRLPGARVEVRRSSDRRDGGRDVTDTDARLFVRGAPAIRPGDRVSVDGEIFEVDGVPVVHFSGRRPVYTTVSLTRFTG